MVVKWKNTSAKVVIYYVGASNLLKCLKKNK